MRLLSTIACIALVQTLAIAQTHQIQLNFNNPTCLNDSSCGLTNCLCNAQISRASCASASTCPTNLGSFTPLAVNSSNMTATTGTNGTSWVFNDTDAALTDNSIWVYAVANSRVVQNPATPQSSTIVSQAISIPASTVAHMATLNFTSSSCTSANNCWFQLMRAVCQSATVCPTYVPGGLGWMWMSHASFPVWNTTATGTTWQVQDTGLDGGLAGGTTYVYVATVCWANNCNAYSPPSAPWSGTTTVGKKTIHPGRRR